MITRTKRQPCFICLIGGLVLCLGATAALAQSDTGRHRDPADESQAREYHRWWLSVGAGVMSSGDLFKVVVNNGTSVPWLPPSGDDFSSDKFVVTFDEDLTLALSLGLRFSRHFTLRGDLSWANLPATAEARVGQTVELYPYERFNIFMAACGLEVRLLSTASAPYLLLAASLVDVAAEYATTLDQRQLGARIGVGYELALGDSWTFGLEIRDTIVNLDTSGYRPEAATPSPPDITYTEIEPQHFFELLAQARIGF